MTGFKIELLIEFGVILLAPIIHTFYLWKYKKVDKQILKQNIQIFGVFYVVFLVIVDAIKLQLFMLLLFTPTLFQYKLHRHQILKDRHLQNAWQGAYF